MRDIDKISVEYIEISKLRPHPNNPNTHTDKQIDLLAEIIEDQRFRIPVIVSNLSNCLVSGHASTMAAQKCGLTKIPAIRQDFADEKEEFMFMTSVNEIARWSKLDETVVKNAVQRLDIKAKKLKLTGIKGLNIQKADFFIKDPLKKPTDPIQEEMAKLPKKKDKKKEGPVSKPGDVWLLGTMELILNDNAITEQADMLIEKWQTIAGGRAVLETMDKSFEEVKKIRFMNDGRNMKTKLKKP